MRTFEATPKLLTLINGGGQNEKQEVSSNFPKVKTPLRLFWVLLKACDHLYCRLCWHIDACAPIGSNDL